MESYGGVSWADCVEHSDITNGEGLALVLQPLATEGGGSEDLLGQHQNMFQTSGGLDGAEVPSSEAVSEWVLERIGEVSRCLGAPSTGVGIPFVSLGLHDKDKQVAVKAMLCGAKADIVSTRNKNGGVGIGDDSGDMGAGQFVESTFLPSFGTTGGFFFAGIRGWWMAFGGPLLGNWKL
ncbi:hypothetical protein CsSME_00031409 [Camellia sinensis var. sinensis]